MGAAFLRIAAMAAANGVTKRFCGDFPERNVLRPHFVERAVPALIGDGEHLETGPAQQKLRVFSGIVVGVLADQNRVGAQPLGRSGKVIVRTLADDHHIRCRLHNMVKDVEQQSGHSSKQHTNPLHEDSLSVPRSMAVPR